MYGVLLDRVCLENFEGRRCFACDTVTDILQGLECLSVLISAVLQALIHTFRFDSVGTGNMRFLMGKPDPVCLFVGVHPWAKVFAIVFIFDLDGSTTSLSPVSVLTDTDAELRPSIDLILHIPQWTKIELRFSTCRTRRNLQWGVKGNVFQLVSNNGAILCAVMAITVNRKSVRRFLGEENSCKD
jgi:hypothetical protein